MYDPSVLKEKLRLGREYRNLKQDYIASKLGLHVTSYNKWEKGTNHPNAETLASIANLENLEISFFFTPEMSPKEADLEFKTFISPLTEAKNRMKELETIAAKAQSEDPVVSRVAAREQLYEICDLIDEEDEFMLSRIKHALIGVLQVLKNPAPQEAGQTIPKANRDKKEKAS